MISTHPNLRHFLALAAIGETGRLSAAAERVYLSQSALTQALRKLEADAGAQLFERSGYGVTATDAGRRLVRRSRRAAELLVNAERELRALQPSGTPPPRLQHNVTTSQLRTLAAVVETGGYSTAARRLGVAQPTVHRAAKEFELAVGVDLFRRASRGVESTDAARFLARYAGLVLAEMRQGFEEVRELQGDTGSRVAIGCLPLARSEFLPMAVTRLLDRYPDARVSILDGPYVEQLHALRYGEIDWLIGALRDPPPTTDVVQESLFDQPLAVVVRPGHPLLDAPPPTVQVLAELEWVAPRALAPARRFFDAFLGRKDVNKPTKVIECSSLITTRSLLLQSDRAALLSPLQIREDVAAGELAVLIDAIPNSDRTIGITTRDDWEPTMVQAEFAGIVRRLAQGLGDRNVATNSVNRMGDPSRGSTSTAPGS
ncbi:MAG: LysR family transcriptional regulator [Woeseiaceae bacterium]